MSNFEIIKDLGEKGDRLFKYQRMKKFCDVEIVVGEQIISAHKIILAASSEYFNNIFSYYESTTRKITLESIDFNVAYAIVKYCYTGTIKVSEKNVGEILSWAKHFKMFPIVEGCIKIMETNINSLNCISTWKCAQLEDLEDLKKIAFDFGRKNFETVSLSPEFVNLNYSEISEFINSNLVVSSEIIVLNSIEKWIKHDITSRKQHFDQLSNCIRFECLPENTKPESELKDPKEGRQILSVIQQMQNKNFTCVFNTLMALGSEYFGAQKILKMFDLKNEKWVQIEKFECDRSIFSAVFLNDELLLIGGNQNRATINKVLSYDLKTGIMKDLPSMKYERCRFSAIVFKGCVYAIGGCNQTGCLSQVEMWNPTMKTWKELAPMLKSRSGCQATVLGEEIFVIGGVGNQNNFLSSTESYNSVTNTWRYCASMCEKRLVPAVAVIGNYIYVVGGVKVNKIYLNTAERYDPTIDKWTMIQSIGINNYSLGAGNLMGKLVVIGKRETGNQVFSTMEMYDQENDTWIPMSSCDEPQLFFRIVEIPWVLAKTILSKKKPI